MSDLLEKYMYKTIEIVTMDGRKFMGKAIDVTYPDETASHEEGIIIQVKEGEMKGSLVEFVPSEISEITVVKE